MRYRSRCRKVYLLVLPDGKVISADAPPFRGSGLTIARHIINTQSSRTLAHFQPDDVCRLELYRPPTPMRRRKARQSKWKTGRNRAPATIRQTRYGIPCGRFTISELTWGRRSRSLVGCAI